MQTAETKEFSTLDFIIAWENGELQEDEVIDGFQHLINSGVVWSLQGFYGRRAKTLIDAGYCSLPQKGGK